MHSGDGMQVQLRTQDYGAPAEELRAVLRCPRLLTDSRQRSAWVTELKHAHQHASNMAFTQQGRTLVTMGSGPVVGWDGKVCV